jgi:hypothetical protein
MATPYRALLRDLLGEELEEKTAILVVGKDIGARIAARRQVIQRPGKLQA